MLQVMDESNVRTPCTPKV